MYYIFGRINLRHVVFTLILMFSFVVSLAYASFRTELGLEGVASVDETFKINITNVTTDNSYNYSGSSLYTHVSSPTSSGTSYDVTFKNSGTLKGKLGAIYVLADGSSNIGYKINVKDSSEQLIGTDSGNYTTGANINTKIDIEEEVVFEVILYCKSGTCNGESKNLIISFSWIQDEEDKSFGNNGYAINLSLEGYATGTTSISNSYDVVLIEESKTSDTSVTGQNYSTKGLLITITNTLGENARINQVNVQTSGGVAVTATCNQDQTSCTFTMPESAVNITIDYGYNSFNITKNIGANGSILVTNAGGTEITQASPGETVNVTYTATEGYSLDTFTVTSGTTTVCSRYCESFVMPNGDVTINVTFGVPQYLVDKILANNDEQDGTNIDYAYTSEEDGTSGLYYTSTNTEDNKITYYFRGAVDNNYVKFGTFGKKVAHYIGYMSEAGTGSSKNYNTLEECQAGSLYNKKCTEVIRANEGDDIYWRIVRINEDGSIRLIYQGNSTDSTGLNSVIGFGAYNIGAVDNPDNAYVGYMYGTPGSDNYEDTHENVNDSTIKEFLDEWYEAGLNNYSSYLSDTGFCNDRSVAPEEKLWDTRNDTALGYGTNWTAYGVYNRLYNNKNPQFKCPNASDDLFTTNGSIKGNNALTNPIGLITADEVAYAGGVHLVSNSNYYLNSGYYYWSMTPMYSIDTRAYTLTTANDGSLSDYVVTNTNNDNGIRPVINLRADIEIISGDGRIGSEYVIKTN